MLASETSVSVCLSRMNQEITGTHQKALHINVDASTYGTFAEIGAGQEVARWFFRVGGAAGTIAKTISAYDMTVSDAIYGPADRYVSRHRLHTMLDHEYGLLRSVSRPNADPLPGFSFMRTRSPRAVLSMLTRRTVGWECAFKPSHSKSPLKF